MNNKVRWAFVGDKGVVTTGNQQFLDEPGTEELKTTGGLPPTFITPALLGMNEGADSQIVVVPKIFPLDLGETIPFGHSLENPLPVCDSYPEGFALWFSTLHWAFTKNSKKPITGTDGVIFNNTNQEPTLNDGDSPGEKVLKQAKQADRQSYQLMIVPILSTSKTYKSSFASTEISASTKFNDYNYANPTANPQVQQTAQLGINANMIITIGTTIATSVVQVMVNNNKKKTSVTTQQTIYTVQHPKNALYMHCTCTVQAVN